MEQTLGSSTQQVLARPVPGGRGLTTQDRERCDLSATIKGWGSDVDAKDRPGVPRDKAPELGVELLYPPIPQQIARIKIYKSTEHGKLTPVFGTSCPPRGLSGQLRDIGYRFSEGRLARWMTLLIADRINVVEDLISDLSQGRVPNVPREMGIRAELRYNAAGFAKKMLILAAGSAAIVALLRMRRR